MNTYETELAQLRQKIRDMKKIKVRYARWNDELKHMEKRAKKLQVLIRKGNR